MGDMGEVWNEHRNYIKAQKAAHGQPCPACKVKLPKAQPKILMPGQKCWCGYRDTRKKEKP